MIESIEGKRGLPRHKPPYPSQVGLFGRPTLVHNVETLYWVRDILDKGPAWFSSEGRNGCQGRRSFSVSGSTNSGNPLVLQFEVLPAGAYEIKDLIIKNLNNINAGGTEWDTIIFGQGQHDYKVTLRDLACKPSSVASIDYEIYLLIKPKQDPESFPVGDYGLIDPLWTNN